MKVDFDDDTVGLRTRLQSDSEILTKLHFIKEHLTYATVYGYYNWPWQTYDTHQISCPFHAKNRDANGVPYEGSPSARYYAGDQQIWCFACTEGGDVSWFIRKKEEHAHYGETVDFIKKNFGIALDGQDLTKRIEMAVKQQAQQDNPRRQMLSSLYEDKVNDEFYRLRLLGPHFHPVADRLEPEVFNQKAELDAVEVEYTTYAKTLRRWLTWTQDLIEQALKFKANVPR